MKSPSTVTLIIFDAAHDALLARTFMKGFSLSDPGIPHIDAKGTIRWEIQVEPTMALLIHMTDKDSSIAIMKICLNAYPPKEIL